MEMLHEIFPHYTIEKCLLLTEAIFEMGQYHIYESDSLLDVYDKKGNVSSYNTVLRFCLCRNGMGTVIKY